MKNGARLTHGKFRSGRDGGQGTSQLLRTKHTNSHKDSEYIERIDYAVCKEHSQRNVPPWVVYLFRNAGDFGKTTVRDKYHAGDGEDGLEPMRCEGLIVDGLHRGHTRDNICRQDGKESHHENGLKPAAPLNADPIQQAEESTGAKRDNLDEPVSLPWEH